MIEMMQDQYDIGDVLFLVNKKRSSKVDPVRIVSRSITQSLNGERVVEVVKYVVSNGADVYDLNLTDWSAFRDIDAAITALRTATETLLETLRVGALEQAEARFGVAFKKDDNTHDEDIFSPPSVDEEHVVIDGGGGVKMNVDLSSLNRALAHQQ